MTIARSQRTPRFNGVKTFSATMPIERARLGERVTEWITTHARCKVVEIQVTQSSDASFHCFAITVFYREELARRRDLA